MARRVDLIGEECVLALMPTDAENAERYFAGLVDQLSNEVKRLDEARIRCDAISQTTSEPAGRLAGTVAANVYAELRDLYRWNAIIIRLLSDMDKSIREAVAWLAQSNRSEEAITHIASLNDTLASVKKEVDSLKSSAEARKSAAKDPMYR